MSWGSRLGSFGRWSPFGSRGGSAQEVTDQDYSYITPEEADSHSKTQDTDVLIFRYNKNRFRVHFPARSISEGRLSVGALRESAARKLEIADARRIRMFYKGRNLKDDSMKCVHEGLRSDSDSQEVLCSIGEDVLGEAGGAEEDSESEDDTVNTGGIDATGGPKKKRNRNRNKKKGRKSGGGGSNTATPPSEYLPLPTGGVPLPGSSSTSTPRTASPVPPPPTPLAKLEALASIFYTTFVPQCVQFTASPPMDPTKREFEHKKLTETILGQVLLKLDGVETEGEPEARARRKELVREVQRMLNSLDAAVKL